MSEKISNVKQLMAELKIRTVGSQLHFECEGSGNFFAETAIVGEFPTDREVQQNLAMAGGSGALLWSKLLKVTGTRRQHYYTTNVSKRMATAKSGKRPLTKAEEDLWCSLLRWELSRLPNLKYVIACGELALNALTGNYKITAWRGSVCEVELRNPDNTKRIVKVICTVNPAVVSREPKLEVVFAFDIGKFKRVIEDRFHPVEVETELYPSPSRVIEKLEQYRDEKEPVATDIELIGLETACVGFANNGHDAFCIPFRTKTKNLYSLADEREVRKTLQKFYLDTDVKFQAQNGMFDMTWLWFKDKIRIHKIHDDSMLGHHALYPSLPHNLGFLTTQYTDNSYYKDEKATWKDGSGDIDAFWRYNGKDCCTTHVACRKINQALKSQGLYDFYRNHIMRLHKHLAQMTVGGIKMDLEMKEHLNESVAEAVNNMLQQLKEKVSVATDGRIDDINPKSPKQMVNLYFSELKLVGRGTKTDAENRKRMKNHPRTKPEHREILDLVDKFAEEQKFWSTYVKTAIDPDGRMRSTYNQTGTQSAPGRLSSSKTLWDSGTNMQNQPERAHPMFVADEGYGLGYFDLAQAEARYVAWDAEIDSWKADFERARLEKGSFDAHISLASAMFGIPYDDIPTFDRYSLAKGHVIPEDKADGGFTLRYVSKRCRHGLNYRMQADRLATASGLSLREAESAFRIYHRTTPELRVWWANLEKEVIANKCLYNAFGRRLQIMERMTPEALESIVAFKPQSSIGDKVCQVIYQSEDHPLWPSNARIMLNIHDALVCIGPIDKLKTCLAIMKYYAELPIIVKGEPMIIPADCKISYPDDGGVHRLNQLKDIDIVSVTS